MSRKTVLLLSIVCLTVYSSLGFASDLPYKPGELIVRFAPKANGAQRTKAERNEVLTSIDGGNIKHFYKLVPGLTVVKLPANRTVENALPAFKTASGILYAEPNYKIKLLSTFPNDPNFGELWGMHNEGQTGGVIDADIDAPEAWDIITSSNIIVAVLDTGIDYNHPDLAGNMWVNEAELNGATGVDDDGNGYIDDIRGWDFADEDNDPEDYYFHGTHCAGTIGAIGNNGVGVTGVCWDVKIMNLKVFPNYGEEWFNSGAIAAIEYGVDNGAHVLSNSWGGGPYSQSLKDEIEAADANGVLFVAAAGNDYGNNNDTYPVYPASYDCENIIAVLSTDQYDNMSDFSNYGPSSVDLGAPGEDILSTFPTYETDAMDYYGFSTDYETISGTSMATPHVAGACALVWSMNRTLSHLQVRDIILNSVDQIQALNGLCVTGGRLNLYNAVINTSSPVLDKVDDVNDGDSVLPSEEITYTIYYANPVTNQNDPNYIGTLTGVTIVDYLPQELDPNNPFDPAYSLSNHRYVWNIGTLSPGNSNSIQVRVIVNELAEPLGKITNVCVLLANEIGPVTSVEVTDVNSWNPGIVYVNKQATGSNTGMSWNNAYRDLRDALERARVGCGTEIWVSTGTYKPSERTIPDDPNTATFQLVNGVPIYGGFAGGEICNNQRNPIANQTILSGDINGDGTGDIQDVVTALGVGQTTIIDGFTITKGLWSGLWCDPNSSPIIANNTFKANWDGVDCNGTPTIINCIVENNACYGIFCLPNSSPTITNSRIWGNSNDGVHCKDSGLAVSNCIIEDNTANGIYDYNAPAAVFANNIIRGNGGNGIFCEEIAEGIEIQIRDNWIHNNGGGIYIDNYSIPPPPAAVIQNNTIVNNAGYGINSLWPEDANISDCIIWGNNSGQEQLYTEPGHGTFNKLRYSCIQNGDTNNGNINIDPLFYDDPNDPNNFHLSSNSPCIDAGNPFADYAGETDIDGEGRVKDGNADGIERVDIGADEYYWSPADFNGDQIVNFIDYAEFALAWQSHPGDHEWRPKCDIAVPHNLIDYNDLAVFCEDWLWQSAWDKPAGFMMMGRSAGETETVAFTASEISLQSISAEQQIEKVAPLKIEQLIKWLEQVWLEEETHKLIDEDLWLKFMESLKKEM